ncbi:MAG: PRC-barrel domain-containing protein [Bacillota bacterium]|nr:PRC-barrel domain-containing protein [Bacillota bacterium]
MKCSEVVGLPVICINSGKQEGVVKDVIFNPREKEATALLLESQGLRVGQKIIPVEKVSSFGKNAVMIEDSSSISVLKRTHKKTEANKGEVRGMKVYSKTGDTLGTVEDVLFDSKSGIIEGLEISDGIYEDLMKGRKVLPVIEKVEFGSENIIADGKALEEMIDTGGGLKKLLD